MHTLCMNKRMVVKLWMRVWVVGMKRL